jgi:small-conductance mechanosensitive channel
VVKAIFTSPYSRSSKAGIEIPFPQQEIRIRGDAEGKEGSILPGQTTSVDA